MIVRLAALLLFALLASMGVPASAQQPASSDLLTGMPVRLEGATGDHVPWTGGGSGRLAAFPGSQKLFVMVKEGGRPGQTIHYGEFVRIQTTERTYNFVNWVEAIPSDPIVYIGSGSPAERDSLLTIERPLGWVNNHRRDRAGEPDQVLFGSPFVLRVATSENWLAYASSGINIETTSDHANAAVFTAMPPPAPVVPPPAPAPPPPLPPPPPPTRHAVSPTFRSDLTGSAILLYATNAGDVSYFCSGSFSYTYESFGESKSESTNFSFSVPGHTSDQRVFVLSGQYVNLQLSGAIDPQCNAQ